MTPADYCLQRIGGRVSNLACSLMFLPRRARVGARALHAFAQEISDVPTQCSDATIAHNKLHWWREEIHNSFRGNARHPVSQALAPLLVTGKIAEKTLLAQIDAYAMDVAPVRYSNFSSLFEQAQRTGGNLQLLILDSLDVQSPPLRTLAHQLGALHTLTVLLQRTGADVRHDRLFIPGQDLERFSVSQSDVLACRESPAFQALMAFQADRIVNLYTQKLAAPPPTHTAVLPGLILAALDRALLTEIRADGYHVLSRQIVLTPLRRLWTTWRTRRHAHRRRHLLADSRLR